MLQIVMHIARNEQIQPPVAVIVTPRSAIGPVAQRYARLLGYVSERAVVVVVVQPILSVVGHKDIGPAIVLKVGDGHAETPAVVRDPGPGGHIGKGPVVVVMEQRRMGRRLLDRKSTRLN